MHSIVSCQLIDHRPELFCASNEQLFHIWKVGTNPDAAWSGWQQFRLPPQATIIRTIGTHSLTDGRPQVWIDTDAGFFSMWKPNGDPKAEWTDWSKAEGPPGF
ncbi:MAG: hypothetical protein HOY79_08115 [Streptomyces sp.]|nr:hypothetical protein [Streptomyces sp.]